MTPIRTNIIRILNRATLGIAASTIVASLPTISLESRISQEPPNLVQTHSRFVHKTSQLFHSTTQENSFEIPLIYRPLEDFDYDPIAKLIEEKREKGERITHKDIFKTEINSRLHQLSQYDDLIKKFADIFGMDVNYAKSLLIIESEGDTHAISPTGPKGLPQFTQATGERYGLFQTKCTDDRFAPEKSIPAFFEHLSDLRYQHRGDMNTAVTASYHTAAPNWYITDIISVNELLENEELNYPRAKVLYTDLVKETKEIIIDQKTKVSELAKNYNLPEKNFRKVNPKIKPKCNVITIGTTVRVPKIKIPYCFNF